MVDCTSTVRKVRHKLRVIHPLTFRLQLQKTATDTVMSWNPSVCLNKHLWYQGQDPGVREYRQTIYRLKALLTRNLMAPIKIALRRVMLRHSSKTLKKAISRAANEPCVIHLMCQESDFKIGSKFWKWVDLSKYRWNYWHRPLVMHFMMTFSDDRT